MALSADEDRAIPARHRLSRGERGLQIPRVTALASVFEPRTVAGHVSTVYGELVLDSGVRRAREQVALNRRSGQRSGERFERSLPMGTQRKTQKQDEVIEVFIGREGSRRRVSVTKKSAAMYLHTFPAPLSIV